MSKTFKFVKSLSEVLEPDKRVDLKTYLQDEVLMSKVVETHIYINK